MKILNAQPFSTPTITNKVQRTQDQPSFGSMLNEYIQKADATIKNSEEQSILLAQGKAVNLHDVTIAAQKASIALQLTVQVRDKAVEAYQEMMRIQV